MNTKVKELLKSVHICQSYHKNESGTFSMAHSVVVLANVAAVYTFRSGIDLISLLILFFLFLLGWPQQKKA